jgi:hypothetical protein
MGRPPLRKKGAFSAAERQRRRRKRLAKEKRAAESIAKQTENYQKLVKSNAEGWTQALAYQRCRRVKADIPGSPLWAQQATSARLFEWHVTLCELP